MTAGMLNTYIHLQRPTETANSNTGEPVTTYTDYHRDVPSHREDTPGGVTRRGQQVEEGVKSVFRCGFIDGISPSWRVKEAANSNSPRTWEIISVIENERRDFMFLHCGDVR